MDLVTGPWHLVEGWKESWAQDLDPFPLPWSLRACGTKQGRRTEGYFWVPWVPKDSPIWVTPGVAARGRPVY